MENEQFYLSLPEGIVHDSEVVVRETKILADAKRFPRREALWS